MNRVHYTTHQCKYVNNVLQGFQTFDVLNINFMTDGFVFLFGNV